MATRPQRTAAQKNIRIAQATWKAMTPRQRALAQPQGRARKRPGTTGKGKFYRIEVRPKSSFTSFRTQDVGKKGGLERVAGRRKSGSWATATWLIDKKHARIVGTTLVIMNAKEKASLMKAIRGPITKVKGDIFHAHPARNVPEREKPTSAIQRALTKAQLARKK